MIASVKLGSGERLASVRELAFESGVNPNTMQRALAELEREGLIYSVRTTGRFVTDNEGLIYSIKENAAKEKIDELFKTLLDLGYTQNQIKEIVLKKIDELKRYELKGDE
jgi:GntR family transcriptional regulator